MKIIVIGGRKTQEKARLMIELRDKNTIKEVKNLAGSLRCRDAISHVLEKGKFIKELTKDEMACTHSDLILTATNAYWNLL